MEASRYGMTDSEWERIKDVLLSEYSKSGRRGYPAKYGYCKMMNVNTVDSRNGSPWRELSERYDQWQVVYT